MILFELMCTLIEKRLSPSKPLGDDICWKNFGDLWLGFKPKHTHSGPVVLALEPEPCFPPRSNYACHSILS